MARGENSKNAARPRAGRFLVFVMLAVVVAFVCNELASYARTRQMDKARATRCISAVMRLTAAEKAHYADNGKYVEADILEKEGYVSKAEIKRACEAPLRIDVSADGEGFSIEARPKNRFRDTCLISATQDGAVYNEEPGACWP